MQPKKESHAKLGSKQDEVDSDLEKLLLRVAKAERGIDALLHELDGESESEEDARLLIEAGAEALDLLKAHIHNLRDNVAALSA